MIIEYMVSIWRRAVVSGVSAERLKEVLAENPHKFLNDQLVDGELVVESDKPVLEDERYIERLVDGFPTIVLFEDGSDGGISDDNIPFGSDEEKKELWSNQSAPVWLVLNGGSAYDRFRSGCDAKRLGYGLVTQDGSWQGGETYCLQVSSDASLPDVMAVLATLKQGSYYFKENKI